MKITSEQVSYVSGANPLTRQKVRVTGQRCYFGNPCHLLSSTFSKNHGPIRGGGVGDKSHGRQGPRPARPARRPAPASEATARVPSMPACGHRRQRPEEGSGNRRGNRSRWASAPRGSGPPPQDCGERRGAPRRERRLGRRRGKESKLHLEAGGGREGRARRSQGRPLSGSGESTPRDSWPPGPSPRGPPRPHGDGPGRGTRSSLLDAGPGPPGPEPGRQEPVGQGEKGNVRRGWEGERAHAAPH